MCAPQDLRASKEATHRVYHKSGRTAAGRDRSTLRAKIRRGDPPLAERDQHSGTDPDKPRRSAPSRNLKTSRTPGSHQETRGGEPSPAERNWQASSGEAGFGDLDDTDSGDAQRAALETMGEVNLSFLTDSFKDRPTQPPEYKPRGKRGQKRKRPEEEDDDVDDSEEVAEPRPKSARIAAKVRGAVAAAALADAATAPAAAAGAGAGGAEEGLGRFQLEDFKDHDNVGDDYTQRAALDAMVEENLRGDSAEAGPSQSRRESGAETG